ncbi:hypothetical protein NEOC84_000072|nr:hypothetical protein [Neochlamydia sp. AcF84]
MIKSYKHGFLLSKPFLSLNYPPYLNLEKGCLQFSIAATYGVRLNGIRGYLKTPYFALSICFIKDLIG